MKIHYNHLGYLPDAPKKFLVTDAEDTEFHLLDSAGNSVFCGPLVPDGIWDKTGESVRVGDFSQWNTPGTFRLFVKETFQTPPFSLGRAPFMDQLRAVIKGFYFQRSGEALPPELAGKWARPAAHPDSAIPFHASMHREGLWNAHGGWYDAGDYGKYIVNAGVSVATLMLAFEMYPEVVSGTGLLEEVRFELEWFLRMQDEDGGVFFKVSPDRWDDFVAPAQTIYPRRIIGKSTASTLNLAACCAQAHRVFRHPQAGANGDEAFAARCLQGAQRAYAWALAHPAVEYPHNTDGSGPYNDLDFEDEFFWTEAELLREAPEESLIERLRQRARTMETLWHISWQKTQNLGWIALSRQDRDKVLRETARTNLMNAAYAIADSLEASPYRVPLTHFEWGSNGVLANEALTAAVVSSWNPEARFPSVLAEAIDYIYGRNAVDVSFVTGSDATAPRFPHHRMSAGDGVDDPVPGLLVGGVNEDREDNIAGTPRGIAYPPENTLPGKSYYDHLKAYASNEVAINWNAPLVFALAALLHRFG